MQAVKTIDNIDKTTNLLVESLQNWYAIYFPELARIVSETDEYLKLVSELKAKENFTEAQITGLVGEKKYRLDAEHAATTSIGAGLKPDDIEQIASFTQKIRGLREERQKINAYLEKVMLEEAPNTTAVIGSTIGARLIATAGSLERLAEFPSSTIQVLGAEKALFAHLTKHTLPPKHGLIFAFPKLRGSPKKLRGKIARKLSSKLSIATKIDFFKGDYIGDKLAAQLDADITRMTGGLAPEPEKQEE